MYDELMDENQGKMEGEVFELRSPVPKNERFEIEVVKDGRSQVYKANMGSMYGTGTSLADALHELANKLDGRRIFGSEKYDDPTETGTKLKDCDYCSGKLWFAKNHNNNWVAIDAQTVDGGEMRSYRVRSYIINDVAGTPIADLLKHPKGQVWIAHPEVCGAGNEPEAPILKEKWRQNREGTLEKQEKRAGKLDTMIHDLEDLSQDL